MASVRSRITAAYGAATVGALTIFAIIVGSQRRAAVLRELTDDALNTAALATAIIERQSVRGVTVDATGGTAPTLSPSITSLLDALPGYIIVGDSTQVLYRSRAVRQFREQELNTALIPEVREGLRKDLETLTGAAYAIQESGVARRVKLNLDEVLLVANLREASPGGGVRRVVVGVSTRRVDDVSAQLLGLSLLVAPVLVLLAVFTAWTLAGRVLEPVEQMVNDVAAITDGRSLHRRVVIEGEPGDELGRLAQTVNDMVGRLETSFVSLRRFTADASHELRTPLAVIRADVERAMTTPQNSHEQAVALEEALQQVSRMTGLVDSLLTLARADEGRFDLIREPVALVPLVREVAETATILSEEPGITVTTPLVQPVTVLGDEERLRQLLLNLATNAVKYCQPGGVVELSLEHRHDEAIVTVKDNGIGIAAADLPFIFDRFWRVDQARSRAAGGGVGLGLAISHWIAQAHGGRIDVHSRLGRGTTFTIVLPAHRNQAGTPNSDLSNS